MNASLSLHLDLAPVDDVLGADAADLRAGGARLGAVRVGPIGLARALAPHVGVPWLAASSGERIVAADRILDDLDNGTAWFSASRAADRFGVAKWLVRAHDDLRLAGWDGGSLDDAPRLATMSSLRRASGWPAGEVDRVHEVLDAVRTGDLRVPVFVRAESPEAFLPVVVRRLLQALLAQGHEVDAADVLVARAPETTDLGRLQRALLASTRVGLTGDGSLTLLEADTPWEAAEAVAALLAREGDLACVVATEPGLLDEARARHGLARLGVASASAARPALQVLPLALDLQLAPRDPETALQLLTLPLVPLRAPLRRALLEALGEQPAVGGPGWCAAAEEALTTLAAEPDGAEVAAKQRNRLERFLPRTAPTDAEGLAVPVAVAIAEAVAQWARGRAQAQPELASELLAAAGAATDLTRLLGRMPPDRRLDRTALRHLHELVVTGGRGAEARTEVGAPAFTTSPAGLPPEVDGVVWWGAVAGAAETSAPLPWNVAERASLGAAGVSLADEGQLRLTEQEGWFRPLLAARSRAVVVRWRSAGQEAAEPHPLLDGVRATVASGLERCTVQARDLRRGALGVDIAAVPALTPRGVWRLPAGSLPLERKLSATQIDTLLSCPLRWTLSYAAGLRPGGVDALPNLRGMIGTFAHALLQEHVLYAADVPFDRLTPEQAKERVLAAFDARVGLEAVPLQLPGRGSLLARVRREIADGASSLVSALRAGGWRPVREAEVVLSGVFAEQPFEGPADLVVQRDDGRLAVVDLKIGGTTPGKKLQEGRAIQIALYAAGLGGETAATGAYFLIEDGRMLSTDAAAFPAPAWHLNGPTLGETLLDAERAWAWWERSLKAGVVVPLGEHVTEGGAEAVVEATGAEPLEGPWAKVKAPCRWCDQRRLCSFAIEGGVA
jgi:ATP-dependent helicase/nuclease subunit B